MTYWFWSFALTVLVELPIVLAAAPPPLRRRILGDAVLVNLFTHPLAWISIRRFGWSWTGVELAVALTELLVYRRITGLPLRRAAVAALLANGVTAGLSFLILI